MRMEQREILSLLGLALRGGNLAVGEEPAEAVCRAKDARLLLLADDAADNTRRRAEHFAQAGACLLVTLPVSKAELGRALGRTSAAIAAVTDAGLAAAVGRRLAAWDPERYGPAAEGTSRPGGGRGPHSGKVRSQSGPAQKGRSGKARSQSSRPRRGPGGSAKVPDRRRRAIPSPPGPDLPPQPPGEKGQGLLPQAGELNRAVPTAAERAPSPPRVTI